MASTQKFLKCCKKKWGKRIALFFPILQRNLYLFACYRRCTCVGRNSNKRRSVLWQLSFIGDHTPEHQKKSRADRASVLMFQPFRGKWVQNIAGFLSKGFKVDWLICEFSVLLPGSSFKIESVSHGTRFDQFRIQVLGDFLGPIRRTVSGVRINGSSLSKCQREPFCERVSFSKTIAASTPTAMLRK